MKKIITTIWKKFLSIWGSKTTESTTATPNQKNDKEFAKAFAKKIEKDYGVNDGTLDKQATTDEAYKSLHSETIHPNTTRKERFGHYSQNRSVIVINNISWYLTEKQIIFYNIILELTEEFGRAKAKDICIRYVGHINKNSEGMETPEWMYKLSAHNKTMKFLLKSGVVIKLSKGYKAIK